MFRKNAPNWLNFGKEKDSKVKSEKKTSPGSPNSITVTKTQHFQIKSGSDPLRISPEDLLKGALEGANFFGTNANDNLANNGKFFKAHSRSSSEESNSGSVRYKISRTGSKSPVLPKIENSEEYFINIESKELGTITYKEESSIEVIGCSSPLSGELFCAPKLITV